MGSQVVGSHRVIEALLHRVPHAVKKDMFRITPGELEGHDGPVVLEGMGLAGEVLPYRLPRRLVLNGLAVDVAAAREWLRIAVPIKPTPASRAGPGMSPGVRSCTSNARC